MHSTIDEIAIATKELNSALAAQVQDTAPLFRVRTPQRKAKYHDKERFRLKRLKETALLNLHANTAQIKKCLQALGIKLDLRLTSAWYAIVFELMPLLARQIDLNEKTFQVGDRVIWTQCPATMSYVEKWFPLQIVRCDREMITLDVLAFPVPASELKLAVA